MAHYCFSCTKDLSGEIERGKAGRTQSCPKCSRDLHVCKNCKHYDTAAYNQCRESNAERVVDKERSNFCDYFSFTDKSAPGTAKADPKKDALKKLNDLFK
jgi:hypothetical protein